MTEPANKTVLITGAGGGFGQHMVRQFCDAGAKLILTDLSEESLAGPKKMAGEALVASLLPTFQRKAAARHSPNPAPLRFPTFS